MSRPKARGKSGRLISTRAMCSLFSGLIVYPNPPQIRGIMHEHAPTLYGNL